MTPQSSGADTRSCGRTVADNLEAARHYQRQYRRLRIEQFVERNWFYLAVAVFAVSVFAAAFVGGAS